MTTTLTDAERAAMQQRAKRTERRLIEAGLDHTITDDILSLLALYEASQAALAGALAELAAARAEVAAQAAADEYMAAEGEAWGPGIMAQE